MVKTGGSGIPDHPGLHRLLEVRDRHGLLETLTQKTKAKQQNQQSREKFMPGVFYGACCVKALPQTCSEARRFALSPIWGFPFSVQLSVPPPNDPSLLSFTPGSMT